MEKCNVCRFNLDLLPDALYSGIFDHMTEELKLDDHTIMQNLDTLQSRICKHGDCQ